MGKKYCSISSFKRIMIAKCQSDSYNITSKPEINKEQILQFGQVELLPFLPLTKGGANRETVSQMFEQFRAPTHKELALAGFTLASLIFKQKSVNDTQW